MNKNVKTALIVALCLVGAGVGFCIVGRALGGSLNGARLWHSPFHSTVRVGDTGVTVGGDGGVKVDGNDVSVGGPWGVNVDGDGVTIGGMHFGSDADFEDDHDDSRDSVSVDAADYRELGGAYSAAVPDSPVRIRTASSTSRTKILPSPILPVAAAALMASTALPAAESSTTASSFTLGTKFT